MANLCGCCQRPIHSNMLICTQCGKTYGVLVQGRWKPRRDWPEWLRFAVEDERKRRRLEIRESQHCIALCDYRESAEA